MSFKFGVPEKRKLFGERRKEWSVYYKFLKIYSNTEFLSTRCGLAALSTVYLSSRKYERPSDAGGWSSLFFLTLTITRTIIVTM